MSPLLQNLHFLSRTIISVKQRYISRVTDNFTVITDLRFDLVTCRNRGSSLCLAVEADPGRAVPVPEARRAQPVSRPRQGRGTRYPRSEGRAVGPQRSQRARGALQRGHAHR